MPFNSKPAKMTFYAILRALLCFAGLYLFISLVIPTWRGAYALYIQGVQPDIVNGVVGRQGSGLSFVPLVGGIQLRGHAGEFTWFYGHYLPYSETQEYTLVLLPHSAIVIDVRPVSGATSTLDAQNI